jgi:hypothetical protein
MVVETVQFHWGGLIGQPADPQLVHLEEARSGRTLCGLSLFAEGGPGFSRGGGYSEVRAPCSGCRRWIAPDATIHGLNAAVFVL